MAVTKIKAIRGTLSKAIAYILNPEKTDEKLLVSSYGCASETAAREFEWTRKIAEQKGMNIFLKANNIFDRMYTDMTYDMRQPGGIGWYSQPGRNFLVGIEYSF